MLFSELEEVLEDLSRNKQRLTVSRHAYNILLQDDEIFEPDKKQNRASGDPSSTLVNQLFQNLYETAESSIWMRLGQLLLIIDTFAGAGAAAGTA